MANEVNGGQPAQAGPAVAASSGAAGPADDLDEHEIAYMAVGSAAGAVAGGVAGAVAGKSMVATEQNEKKG